MENKAQKKSIALAIAGFTAVVVLAGLIGYFTLGSQPDIIQGEVEVAEYRVSSKVPGRILELRVKEGDYVHVGDTLAILDAPEVEAKKAQALGAEDAASAMKDMADNGARQQQIQGAYELWQQAKAGLDIAKKTYDRVQRLFGEGVMSAQKRDEAFAAYKAYEAQEKAAKSQYDMAVNGARAEDKAAAAALVDQANGALMEVNAALAELYLTSPASGIISATFPKVGELVGQGSPIMTITDLDDMWFTFNVREDYLHGLKQGDKVTVSVPALDDKECTATVTYIAVRESYATWKATKETGMYDAKTFEVRAVPDTPLEGLRPGMSAIVKDSKILKK